MRTVLLSALLMLAATPTFAEEWHQYAVNALGTAFYVDLGSIRKNGNLRRAWLLQDYKTPMQEMGGARSAITLDEFDCLEERERMLQFTSHYYQMARGGVIDSFPIDPQWKSIQPGSITSTALRLVCAP